MTTPIKISHSATELQKIIQLRYEVLRAPWGQSADTATDEQESLSVNAYIENEEGDIIASGRLQKNSDTEGQIRFMAVRTDYQGKGLGRDILKALEKEAMQQNLKVIELQARENAMKFYLAEGYEIVAPSFKLWDIIQHYLMRKEIAV
jgi:predicted GNAT family N-acyltransferase